MLDPGALYAPIDAAAFFKVNVCSIYQSLPGKRTRSKLGRRLPEPIRFGRMIRWTGQQLIDFASPMAPSTEWPAENPLVKITPAARRPGRPRNVDMYERKGKGKEVGKE